MSRPITIVGFGGSLRKDSLNAKLLESAKTFVPDGAVFTIESIAELPLFNQDLEQALPPSVQKLKAAVEAADAIVIVTPEYNYSVPGFLKNALDWLSRPYGKNSLEDKPVAIMSASMGMLGGSRAQYHLRQVLVFMNAHPLNRPEVMVPAVQEKFDASGKLTDKDTERKVREMLDALIVWTTRITTRS
jgi:chromate reductase